MSKIFFLCVVFVSLACAHGVPTPVATGPLHVEGSSIKDSTGQFIPLRGAQLPSIADMNDVTFGIMRLHWNFNAVRLPVSSAMWRRDGQKYLDQVAAIVKAANDRGLIAVLANFEDGTGLPGPDSVTFWTAWSTYFKDTPLVIFDLFNEPSVADVPGHVAGQRLPADWRFWLNGGTSSQGRAVAGMQAFVAAIRSTGATQVIAASAFHDNFDFQGFGPEFFIQDPNVVYEVHPFFDHALTDADRDRNFGFLARTVPLYAGEWGLILTEDTPACQAVPADPQQANDLLFQTLAYFDRQGISWTAASFEANSLLRSIVTFDPSLLDKPWTCGVIATPEPGMGQVLLLWLTGDPLGFGSIATDFIASAAGGPAGPVSPGEVVTVFGFLFGPQSDVGATLDPSGKLPTSLANLQVFFDGEAAPLFTVGPYEIVAQVPYSVQGKTQTNVQLIFSQVPTDTIGVTVVEAAPRIVMGLGTSQARALNQDGSLNSFANPAPAGSVIALFATGCGQTAPAATTGRIAQPPYGQLTKPVSITIGGASAEVQYAGEAPLSVGLIQVNVRVPGASGGKTQAAPVVLTLGGQTSLAGVTIWTR